MDTRTIISAAAALATLSLSACTQTTDANAEARIKAPAAVAVGEPVDCVETSLIDDTKVWDDYTIDFRMRNGVLYRNTLPNGCPNLGFDERFTYKTTIGRLCSVDTITVLPSGSSIPGPTCGLGKFVPVKLAGG